MAIIQTHPSSDELAHAAADHFATLAQEAIHDHGKFSVALAGGSTPRATYEILATIEYAQKINWERVHVFWGDERLVPPDHQDSNYRMASEAMLKVIPIPNENIHRIHGEAKPHDAAREYAETIRDFFNPHSTSIDLILLGMGDDGHTASIFPGTEAVFEDSLNVMAHYVEKLNSWRITFTPRLINAAQNVTFLVSGERKARRLRQVLVGPYQPEILPSQVVRPSQGRLRWLVDEAAALHL
ncbi:MAG: 6-phosphogluconolactonase [Anaerolineales bacterium]|nr:6-phosphogluconolactonase [Chloroflexota bacterium]MBL6979921.1 6-phosphogluconolactonase [Anaerolineales bacterium]